MSEKNNRHVLLSAAGTGTAYAMALSLRKTWGEAVLITTIDTNPSNLVTTSLFSNQHFICPPAVDNEYESFITNLISKNDVTLFCPLLNDEFKHITSIAKNTRCLIMAPQLSVKLACSKVATAHWLQSIGLPVPPMLNKSELRNSEAYFAKPNNGFGSKQSRIVAGHEAIRLIDEDYIIQPICSSPEVTVDTFFDDETDCCKAVARERIETKAGVCTKARIYEDENLSEFAYRIGRALNQRGVFCFQTMMLDGERVITDLNFRPGAGTAMTVAAGVDLLSAAFACQWHQDYRQFLSQRIPREGIIVTRQYSEFVMR